MTWMMGQSVPSASLLKLQNCEELLIQLSFVLPFSGISSGWRKCRSWPWGRTTPCTRESGGQLIGKQLCRKRSGGPGGHHCASSMSQQCSLVAKTSSILGHAEGSIISSQRRRYVPLYLALVRQI